jgi:transposase
MSTIQLTSSQRRELRNQLRSTEDVGYYRRLLAVLELSRGKSMAEVADLLCVTRQTVYNWVRCFAAHPHPATLQDHCGKGRPSAWDEQLEALLLACLEQHPMDLGYAGMNWTVSLFQEHLFRCSGRWLSDDTIRRLLDRLGFVWKRFRYKLPPDPEREKKTRDSTAVARFAATEREAGRGRDGSAAVPALACRLDAARRGGSGADQWRQRQASLVRDH